MTQERAAMAKRASVQVKQLWCRLPAFCAAFVLACATAVAQNSFDRGTPTESKPGAFAASTYTRDKLETVNLANGNLSMSIPLVTVGGRGSASDTIALSYNSKVGSAEHGLAPADLAPFDSPIPGLHHDYAYHDNSPTD